MQRLLEKYVRKCPFAVMTRTLVTDGALVKAEYNGHTFYLQRLAALLCRESSDGNPLPLSRLRVQLLQRCHAQVAALQVADRVQRRMGR